MCVHEGSKGPFVHIEIPVVGRSFDRRRKQSNRDDEER